MPVVPQFWVLWVPELGAVCWTLFQVRHTEFLRLRRDLVSSDHLNATGARKKITAGVMGLMAQVLHRVFGHASGPKSETGVKKSRCKLYGTPLVRPHVRKVSNYAPWGPSPSSLAFGMICQGFEKGTVFLTSSFWMVLIHQNLSKSVWLNQNYRIWYELHMNDLGISTSKPNQKKGRCSHVLLPLGYCQYWHHKI